MLLFKRLTLPFPVLFLIGLFILILLVAFVMPLFWPYDAYENVTVAASFHLSPAKAMEFFKDENADPIMAKTENCFFKITEHDFGALFDFCIYNEDSSLETPHCQNCPHYIQENTARNIIRAIVKIQKEEMAAHGE